MLQRILGSVLIVLGLAAAALGVATATVWRQSDTVVATATPQGDGTLVVTDPGVLELVSTDVTVRASVPDDGQVTLAVGRDVDVDGWVGEEAHARITGLSDWDTLAVEPVAPGEGAAAPTGADPAGSDMWVAETTGEGTVTLRWNDHPGRWSLLAAGVGEGAQAPTVELTWPRSVSTPWLWPGVGAGIVLVGLGVWLLLAGRGRRGARETVGRERGARGAESAAGTATDDAAAAATGATAAPTLLPWEKPGDAPTPPRAADEPARPVQTPAAATAAVPAFNPAASPAAAAARGTLAPVGAARAAGDASAAPATAPVAAAAGPAAASGAAPEGAAAEGAAAASDGGASAPLTRRELRAREEARRHAEQPSVGRRLRALTGSIPVVGQRPTPAPAPQDGREDGSSAAPAPVARSGRAAAWRATWGFGDEAGAGKARGEKLGADRSGTGSPSTDQPGTDQPGTDHDDTDRNDEGGTR